MALGLNVNIYKYKFNNRDYSKNMLKYIKL